MQTKVTSIAPTVKKLSVVLSAEEIKTAKDVAVEHLGAELKLAGFRAGKAPTALVEKSIDPAKLQEEVILTSVNTAYSLAVNKEKLRPVSEPRLSVEKFVPYETLEFSVEIDVIGEIKLPDYQKTRLPKPKVSVTAKEVEEVLKRLQNQMADKKSVKRAAKDGDEVLIDFDGTDEAGKPVSGASGKAYPLTLGSKTFIPGFEENLIGLKTDGEKEFTLTFPKDYGVSALQNRKVTFKVKVVAINEVTPAAVDEKLVAKVNPSLKTVEQLKQDIKQQLQIEKQQQADRNYENDLINGIVDKSTVDIPEELINQQVESVERELRQNLAYRGLTLDDYLANNGLDETSMRQKELLPEAERRLKTGLVLGEIADQEKLAVSKDEAEARLELYKQQYKSDPQMQAELDKPENRREIVGRLLTEKTIDFLVKLAAKKA